MPDTVQVREEWLYATLHLSVVNSSISDLICIKLEAHTESQVRLALLRQKTLKQQLFGRPVNDFQSRG